ncbi:membrane protein insertion efficiency factor YidD [Natronoglycomyces albus]|uniref:Putative membrane protein insertion efficiency factor n=1 Tax=Natronoglycomyces albus TaxID=2811108 RepID=A0A895XY49_9ACTN|nr:membrane protein insertion efficiency factor YidD [Natronoglycomyces albus]QSB07120.1 membrane protein insertion efficiency factor YidD [Natronoglycomyces albus]
MFAARVLSWPVIAYRRWVSPAIPNRCRFYPSCSAYALDAIQIHGAARGLFLTLRRLARCHPFHPGGYDPVPGREGADAPEAETADSSSPPGPEPTARRRVPGSAQHQTDSVEGMNPDSNNDTTGATQ